ncbi:hypothetical protein IU11_12865 [Cellulosimicrobium sp. MM]|nr:hypothetical protein IU11_12865 [Cellulosimicrobium sp. MM]
MLDVFTVHMRDEENEDDEAAHRHHHELVEAVARQDAAGAAAAVAAIFDPFLPADAALPSVRHGARPGGRTRRDSERPRRVERRGLSIRCLIRIPPALSRRKHAPSLPLPRRCRSVGA